MKVKRAKSSYLLLIGIMTLLMSGSFLAYGIYSAYTKSQINSTQAEDIKPLSGSLNQEVIKNLESRRQFSVTDLSRVQSISYEATRSGMVTSTK
ncbi:MAG: hypothetical protein ACD_57C00048G0002 [uncultured bacterium]|nr:MAG: hypothetical protein ACD_57C00048G0002 [uncultured bacterium]